MTEVSVDDLTELYRAGAVKMPKVAVQYAEMAERLHKTALSETGAFARTGGGLGPLHPVWTQLRNLVQSRIAVRSHDRILAAGEVLTKIADAFATADNLNGEDLAEYEEYVTTVTESPSSLPENDKPPLYVPDAPAPGDPHPEEQPQDVFGVI